MDNSKLAMHLSKLTSPETRIHYLTRESFQAVIQEGFPMVVDCYSDWCPACSEMKPAFESLALEYGDQCLFAKVRTDEDSDLSHAFHIDAIPTFLFLLSGKLVGRVTGSIGYVHLKEGVEQLLQLARKTEQIRMTPDGVI